MCAIVQKRRRHYRSRKGKVAWNELSWAKIKIKLFAERRAKRTPRAGDLFSTEKAEAIAGTKSLISLAQREREREELS